MNKIQPCRIVAGRAIAWFLSRCPQKSRDKSFDETIWLGKYPEAGADKKRRKEGMGHHLTIKLPELTTLLRLFQKRLKQGDYMIGQLTQQVPWHGTQIRFVGEETNKRLIALQGSMELGADLGEHDTRIGLLVSTSRSDANLKVGQERALGKQRLQKFLLGPKVIVDQAIGDACSLSNELGTDVKSRRRGVKREEEKENEGSSPFL